MGKTRRGDRSSGFKSVKQVGVAVSIGFPLLVVGVLALGVFVVSLVGNASAEQLIGQVFAIRCSESPNPRPAAFPILDGFAFRRSGPLGPWWSWQSLACGSWRASAADRYAGPWGRRTANPVLVLNTTRDPATPYRGAVAMSRQLARARLLRVDGYGHTVLANPSACANRYVSLYLIDKALPPAGTRCQQDRVPFRGKP